MSIETINRTENINAEQENKESLITKFLKTMADLRKQKLTLAEQIKKTENNTEKQIMEADLETIKKRIGEYEISISKYRNTTKAKQLKNVASEESVAEIIDFKKKQKLKNTATVKEDFGSKIGKKFLSDFENFKEKKRG